MGQSASTTAATTKKPHKGAHHHLCSDIFELSEAELRTLWKDHPLTASELQPFVHAQATAKKTGSDAAGVYFYDTSSESYANHGSSSGSSGARNNKECPREMALAVRLLKIADLAQLRFRLVPSKMKEDVFWQAVLAWLKERLVSYNTKQHYFEQYPAEKDAVVNGSTCHAELNGEPKDTTARDDATPTMNSNKLQQLVQAKNVEIAALRGEVEKLKKALAAVKHHHHNNHINNDSKRQHHGHKGPWKMDRDSQEFLKYPNDVKESLRQEKQRRIQQVQDELKFILDSDDPKHTHGRWECCGETKYHAHCSM